MNLWTRRRLVPGPDGGSSVRIISFGLFSSDVRLCVPGLCGLLSTVFVSLCSLFPWVVGLSGRMCFECVMVVFILKSSATTVGLIVTVFLVGMSVYFLGMGGGRPFSGDLYCRVL